MRRTYRLSARPALRGPGGAGFALHSERPGPGIPGALGVFGKIDSLDSRLDTVWGRKGTYAMTRFVSRSLATAVLILAAAGANGQEATAAATPANPYTPPACVSGVPFSDITCTTGFDPWIEQFGADGITAGCGGGKYCPSTPVTRDQMAVFIEKAMHGTSAWSPGNLGNYNTGLGAGALLNNGAYLQYNTAVGYEALATQSFTNGNTNLQSNNTAVGAQALVSDQPDGNGSNGLGNTAVGSASLLSTTTGYYETAIGMYAGWFYGDGPEDTFVGAFADAAATGLVDATAIGYNAAVDASYHVRIGDTAITQIGGQVAWSNLSDARHKQDIRDLDLGLAFVMGLRPVSFTMKQGNARTDMGFIAQDVEELMGDDYNVLGIGGDKDRTLSLRYTDFIAPLVKAVQEQQAQIENRDARIAALENQRVAQQTTIEALVTRLAAIEARLAGK